MAIAPLLWRKGAAINRFCRRLYLVTLKKLNWIKFREIDFNAEILNAFKEVGEGMRVGVTIWNYRK